jgi:hypothetical protein
MAINIRLFGINSLKEGAMCRVWSNTRIIERSFLRTRKRRFCNNRYKSGCCGNKSTSAFLQGQLVISLQSSWGHCRPDSYSRTKQKQNRRIRAVWGRVWQNSNSFTDQKTEQRKIQQQKSGGGGAVQRQVEFQLSRSQLKLDQEEESA